MKRKDFTAEILNIIGGKPTGYNNIYCDKSKSVRSNNKYYIRFKFPCFSTKVCRSYNDIENKILNYLHSIGDNTSYVNLNYGYLLSKKLFYIEIVCPNGMPWRNYNKLVDGKQVQSEQGDDEIVIKKSWLVTLLQTLFLTKYTNQIEMLADLDDDKLIEIYLAAVNLK